jgi:hypothetical protein
VAVSALVNGWIATGSDVGDVEGFGGWSAAAKKQTQLNADAVFRWGWRVRRLGTVYKCRVEFHRGCS